MSDLRPLRRIKKTVACASGIAVLLAVVGIAQAAEPATRPATMPATGATTRPAAGFSVQPYGDAGDLNALMWQMLSAALVVLVIGGLALFVIKRLLPRIRYTVHRRISVLETVYLGSRKTVHLLQVGSVKLLVASSPEGVVRLDDVTHAFDVEYADVAQRVGSKADRSAGGTGHRDKQIQTPDDSGEDGAVK
jgi:flagellar biogenesis protein FliO